MNETNLIWRQNKNMGFLTYCLLFISLGIGLTFFYKAFTVTGSLRHILLLLGSIPLFPTFLYFFLNIEFEALKNPKQVKIRYSIFTKYLSVKRTAQLRVPVSLTVDKKFIRGVGEVYSVAASQKNNFALLTLDSFRDQQAATDFATNLAQFYDTVLKMD